MEPSLAARPLIATVGLMVAGELLAQHQMNKKLDSIKRAIHRVEGHLNAQERAILTTADKEARKVAGYLIDQATLPEVANAGHAFGQLAELTNKQIERLDSWVRVAERYQEADHVNGAQLMTALVGRRDDQIQQFEQSVAETYEALALSARIGVLQQTLHSPCRSGGKKPSASSCRTMNGVRSLCAKARW